jgi:dihydropteroate synthase
MAAAQAPATEDHPVISVPAVWAVRDGALAIEGPLVMGVVNVTPDSFSDGGRYLDPEIAIARAAVLVDEGAALLDIGGESTRPGAAPVPAAEEIERVVPVIRGIRARGISVPISIDTRKAAVARAALEAGAHVVNDVSALGDPAMAGLVCDTGAGLVLMHMRGSPATMQDAPAYDDVVGEVVEHLTAALARAERAGIPARRVVVDPGIGFGKTADHNLELLGGLPRLARIGRPVLLGVSRKAFLGRLLDGAGPDDRLAATIGACVAGYLAGARIFRVHDVRPVLDALRVAAAISARGAP